MSAKSSNSIHHHLGKIASIGAQTKKKRQYRWMMLALLPIWVLTAFLISNLLVAGLLWLLSVLHVSLEGLVRPAIYQTVVATIVYILTLVIAMGAPYVVIRQKTTLAVLGLNRLPSWSDIGLAPLTFVAYTLVSAGVLALAAVWLPSIPLDQAQDVGFKAFGSRTDNILAFMTLVIVAPIAEEVLFRGYLYGKLKGYVPAIWAALATSLLFGIAHFQWNVGIDVFILSMFLCGLRSLTGSIWAGILVHILKNALAYYILFINPLLGG